MWHLKVATVLDDDFFLLRPMCNIIFRLDKASYITLVHLAKEGEPVYVAQNSVIFVDQKVAKLKRLILCCLSDSDEYACTHRHYIKLLVINWLLDVPSIGIIRRVYILLRDGQIFS